MVTIKIDLSIRRISFLIIISALSANGDVSLFTISANPSKGNACDQLERQSIDCKFSNDGSNKLLDIKYHRADIAKVTAEELLLALPHLDNIDIIGEIRDEYGYERDSQYQLIVVTTTNIRDYNDLKGKKYCHPGNNFNIDLVNNYLLNDFERNVIRTNNLNGNLCEDNNNNNSTYFENYIKTIATYFGKSCRPVESTNSTINEKLYKLYPSLNDCPEDNGFQSSLKCLVDGGDIAVTTYNVFVDFFQKPEYQNLKQNYHLFCRNGSVTDSEKPCYWNKQPWNLIVTSKDKTNTIVEYLRANMGADLISNISEERKLPTKNELLSFVIIDNPNTKLKLIDVHQRDPINYFKQLKREIPSDSDINLCDMKMKWIVKDVDKEKCEWLKTASINQGFVPTIECIVENDELKSLKMIKNNEADVTVVSNYGYYIHKYNLQEIIFTESKTGKTPSYVLMLNNSTSMTSFADFENKKACLPEYGSNEMIAFTQKFLRNKDDSKTNLLLQLGESCMPGIMDDITKTQESDQPEDKLCNLCEPTTNSDIARNCKREYGNRFYKNGTLLCLDKGDFAVINRNEFPVNEMSKYYVLCKNGTIVKYDKNTVDENCALFTIPQNIVVTNKDNKRTEDFRLVFETFENYYTIDSTFYIFNEFNSTKNLLFPDSVTGFAPLQNIYVENYKMLMKDFEDVETMLEETEHNNSVLFIVLLVISILLIIIFAIIVIVKYVRK